MSFFVQPTDALTPKTVNVRTISLLLAAVLIIMVVAQLFSFEDYSDVLVSSLGLLEAPALIMSAIIVILEIAALPFLFSMRLSALGRLVSMVSGWLVVSGWFLMTIYTNVTMGSVSNSGVLGAAIPIPSGWWMTSFFAGVMVLMIWSSWGMWPFVRNAKK